MTAHLERLEYDLRIATANGETQPNQRLSEVSAQLAGHHPEADQLRAQLDNHRPRTRLDDRPVQPDATDDPGRPRRRRPRSAPGRTPSRQGEGAAAARLSAQTPPSGRLSTPSANGTRRTARRPGQGPAGGGDREAEQTRRQRAQGSQAVMGAATAESERLVSEATAESRATLTAARDEALPP